LYLIHALVLVAAAWRGDAIRSFLTGFRRFPPGSGYSLGVAYVVWIGVVLALYPLCRWFAGVKARRRDVWLRYL
jgi:hypothetical protein